MWKIIRACPQGILAICNRYWKSAPLKMGSGITLICFSVVTCHNKQTELPSTSEAEGSNWKMPCFKRFALVVCFTQKLSTIPSDFKRVRGFLTFRFSYTLITVPARTLEYLVTKNCNSDVRIGFALSRINLLFFRHCSFPSPVNFTLQYDP